MNFYEKIIKNMKMRGDKNKKQNPPNPYKSSV
jgi:hypothetical protein